MEPNPSSCTLKLRQQGMKGLAFLICLSPVFIYTSAQDPKRAPFNSWAGKRFDPSLYRERLNLERYGQYLPALMEVELTENALQGLEKRGSGGPRAFSSWAGKRAPFSSWAGKRSGESVERPRWYPEEYARKKRSIRLSPSLF